MASKVKKEKPIGIWKSVIVGSIIAAVLGIITGMLGPVIGGIFLGVVGACTMIWVNKLADEDRKNESHSEESVVAGPKVHMRSADESGRMEIDWYNQMVEIRRAWEIGNYDFARTWLEKLAYTLHSSNAPKEVHDKFKELMVAFAKADPLYSSIINAVLPVIKSQPGIIQSQLSKSFPQFDAEQFRYVMYYSEMIGDLRREKKGRSYELFPTQLETKAKG